MLPTLLLNELYSVSFSDFRVFCYVFVFFSCVFVGCDVFGASVPRSFVKYIPPFTFKPSKGTSTCSEFHFYTTLSKGRFSYLFICL